MNLSEVNSEVGNLLKRKRGKKTGWHESSFKGAVQIVYGRMMYSSHDIDVSVRHGNKLLVRKHRLTAQIEEATASCLALTN